MRNHGGFSWTRPLGLLVGALVLSAAIPSTASAQYRPPSFTHEAIGERYHVELRGTMWNPSLFGVVSSEQFGIVGNDIDFVKDLGFEKTRFREMGLTLRPGKKHKFRAQYMPMVYTSDTVTHQNLVFNGIEFPASVPVVAEFDWKVWKFGYEYDFVYRDRGFVGILFEARLTDFSARLASPLANEYTTAKGPLPALGLVARAYVLPMVALNFEVSGFKVPNIQKKYEANYYDWDIHATMNVTNNLGAEVGWRRSTTFLLINHDKGDMKFQGMWFGAALRY
jgi:hypothetical protein